MNKICPEPHIWLKRHKAMMRIAQSNGLPDPPKALVLAGWAHSEDWEKKLRWEETINWCKEHGCTELTEDIGDEDWYQSV